KKSVIQPLIDELNDNKSKLPLICVEIISPDSGKFNWKDFYIRILQSADEPLINKKVNYQTLLDNQQGKKNNFNLSDGPANLRLAVENLFIYRNPEVFIIDEAQHFLKMASGKRYIDQLDTLKSLYNKTNVPLVLVGTYELSAFMDLSGQLSKRTNNIEF
ncbi:AAA family ATPase, partial [Bacillus sp. JJ664]